MFCYTLTQLVSFFHVHFTNFNRRRNSEVNISMSSNRWRDWWGRNSAQRGGSGTRWIVRRGQRLSEKYKGKFEIEIIEV